MQVSLTSHGGHVTGIRDLRVFNGGKFYLQSVEHHQAELNADEVVESNQTGSELSRHRVALDDLHVFSGGVLELLTHRYTFTQTYVLILVTK